MAKKNKAEKKLARELKNCLNKYDKASSACLNTFPGVFYVDCVEAVEKNFKACVIKAVDDYFGNPRK